MFKGIYDRQKYLNKIRPFYNSDIIKVITGIRRCGKSCILKSIINELIASGIDRSQIIYLPLDKRGFKDIKSAKMLEERIESLITDTDFYYLFIDEVQNVQGFEKVVHAYAEEGWSIFLTGSNSYLLSDEITTKLTGRYLKFETYVLDFKEYLDMKLFFKQDINTDIDKEFDEYIQNGGFPKSLEFKDMKSRQFYTASIIDEIFEKDIKSRNKIRNIAAYERIQSFILNNYASSFTLTNLLHSLEENKITVKSNTVRRYISDLLKAKIIYECNRFDLKSHASLKREQKYYLADMSIYFALNTDNRLNYGPSLENIVYLYLVSSDYNVSVGVIGKFECDFIIRNSSRDYAYIQVCYSLHGASPEATSRIKEREYRPFRYIKESYPRYIISLDKYPDQQEGVRHINAIDLFLGKVSLF